jgi:hypothetical protein
MPEDSYNLDDSFDENNETFLKKDRSRISSSEACKELKPQETPLTISDLDSFEEMLSLDSEEKTKEKKRPEIDDTEVIKKEIVEAKKLIRNQYNYKEVSPRLLKAMVVLFQEHALLGKTVGIRSEKDSTLLMFPVIENDGIREIVVMRSPVVGSLERHKIRANSELFETLKDYYNLHHS